MSCTKLPDLTVKEKYKYKLSLLGVLDNLTYYWVPGSYGAEDWPLV